MTFRFFRPSIPLWPKSPNKYNNEYEAYCLLHSKNLIRTLKYWRDITVLLCLVRFSLGQTMLKSETFSAQKVSVLSRFLSRFKQKTYTLRTSSPAESQRDVIFHFKCYSLNSIKIWNCQLRCVNLQKHLTSFLK